MAAYKSPLDLGRDLQEEDAQKSRVVSPIEYIDPTGKKWTRGDFKDETNLANEYGRTRNTMAYDKGRIYKDNRSPERQGLDYARNPAPTCHKSRQTKNRALYIRQRRGWQILLY